MINFLPSWKDAVDPLRTCDEDGTHHFSALKKLALSGRQYLHAVNAPSASSAAMRVGTCAHLLVLGARPGAPRLVRYDGRRAGKAWEDFEAANVGAEILTASEWTTAEAMAEAVRADPVARARLDGARCEVPLSWEEDGLTFSTSGVDIITRDGALGDLKTTQTTFPEAWMRHAFRSFYPQQLAFYRRGARANGIALPNGLFCLGVESKAPHEVVDLELTEAMIDFADRTVSLWIEKLRVYRDACPAPRRVTDWPGYAQASVPWDAPSWATEEDDEEEEAAE
jgi:hypothetical protein